MKKSRTLIESFNYAIDGIIYSIKTQRNIRIHLLAAFLVMVACLFFNFSTIEFLLIFFTIALVIMAEMINTAIEATVDLVTEKYHPLAKVAKNVAAGAVLVSALNALVVGYLLFYRRLEYFTRVFLFKARNAPEYIFFTSLMLVVLFVILLKVKFKTGTPLKGGLPSGHTAVAFSILTFIFFTSNSTAFLLTALLTLLVAESRLETGIHSLKEIILGAAIGTAVTSFFFWMFG